MQGFRPHYDFVRAIKPVSSSFAGALEIDLIRKERKDEEAPSIIDLVKEFKEHYRMQQQASPTTTANHSAFATLQSSSNSNLDCNHNHNSNSQWHKKCICGLIHRYGDRCYIVEQKRPQGWKPDPHIQQKVDEMISSIPWVKRMVNRVRKDTEELVAENTESTIDFDSKSAPPSTTPTSHAAMFSTG